MKKLFFSMGLLLVFTIASAQRDTLRYEVSFPNAVHHEAQVSLIIPEGQQGALRVRMSRSSPGRYATHEFGKNVYNVKAFNAAGKAIEINQVAGDVYEIPQGGYAKVSYSVFGNWVDGTYLGIDETHAHMNMPATFMYVPSMADHPIKITFHDLDRYAWKVATQLKPGELPNVFSAPDLQYFMDSPTELSSYKLVHWTDINNNGTRQQLRLSSHTADEQLIVERFAKMVEHMAKEAKAVFGQLPEFDYGTYTFIQDVHPHNAGDGMEHRNSTIIVDPVARLAGNEESILSTFSHEFFHAWNVERIRPKSLQPFNFEQANLSNELWFAEGFTQYYGELILKRAGFSDVDAYASTLGGILNYVLNSPGAKEFSATRMSRYAVFADAGVAVDKTNNSNTFTSYYFYGAAIALALDLRLRTEFNHTLDDYMQAVWRKHGESEDPYTISDLQGILSGLTNEAFAADFFKRYVYGTEKSDYESLLSFAGLILRKAAPGKATIGTLRLTHDQTSNKYRVMNGTLRGTPAYEAGIEEGDYLIKIGETDIKSASDVENILERYKPGEPVNLTFEHKGLVRTRTIEVQENNRLEIVPIENAGGKLTPAMENFRNNWLSSKIK